MNFKDDPALFLIVITFSFTLTNPAYPEAEHAESENLLPAENNTSSYPYLTQETLEVQPTGKEIFSSLPLDPDYEYHAKVTGTFRYYYYVFLGGEYRPADALYFTDNTGSFTRFYSGLRFDAEDEFVSGDRATHTYTFKLRGHGERLVIRLFPPDEASNVSLKDDSRLAISIARGDKLRALPKLITIMDYWHYLVSFTLLLLLLAYEGFRIVASPSTDEDTNGDRRREEDRRRVEAERVRKEQEAAKRLAEDERRREAEEARIQTRLRELADLYEGEDAAHYEDDAWLKDRAKKYCERILEDKGHILKKDAEFHKDAAFIDRLRTTVPHLYRRACWQKRLLFFAEQLDVGEPPPPSKETPEAYTERWIKNLTRRLGQATTIEETVDDWIASRIAYLEDPIEREQERRRLQAIAGKAISDLNKGKDASSANVQILGKNR